MWKATDKQSKVNAEKTYFAAACPNRDKAARTTREKKGNVHR
jgi:hypothetical protein